MYNHQTWIKETDPYKLKQIFARRLNRASFKVLDILEHHFQPYGYTCIFLLSESHLALHTFPEEQKTYVELSSCVLDKHIKYLQLFGNE